MHGRTNINMRNCRTMSHNCFHNVIKLTLSFHCPQKKYMCYCVTINYLSQSICALPNAGGKRRLNAILANSPGGGGKWWWTSWECGFMGMGPVATCVLKWWKKHVFCSALLQATSWFTRTSSPKTNLEVLPPAPLQAKQLDKSNSLDQIDFSIVLTFPWSW